MATPGRTHIPWQTQEGQIAELISYISFLEAKLSYLQFHHEHCDLLGGSLVLDSNLPYLPPDIVVANDEAAKAGTHLQLPLTPPAPATPHTPEASVSPPAQSARVKTLPKKGSSPRWKRIVDQMLAGWEQPGSWADKRTSIGLHSVEQNQHVLTLILGLKNETPHADTEIDYFNTGAIKQSEQSASDFLINSARKYALDTKSSATDPDHVAQIHLFREFVFASLCVVMEQQGLPIDTINDLMRICMSSSGPANLYRLRRGALWVNRVIAGTLVKKLGWNYNATEFFLLSGRPVSQYGLLWEACAHSFPYLSKRLVEINDQVVVPLDQPGWIPFSIPLIIKGLVGEALSLEQICLALDYDINAL